ncbi:unnamed protein product [Sphenostylis stenocarpa]|uniref:RNA helicase n=1 Tax=Sphenostylis stenocarpa TaxID=92480 RepID=A0AA86SLZ3_9FABA|nr:unnamed protein product [Sphenostylis stenocarpa]
MELHVEGSESQATQYYFLLSHSHSHAATSHYRDQSRLPPPVRQKQATSRRLCFIPPVIFIGSVIVSSPRAFFFLFFFVWIRVFVMENTDDAGPSQQHASPNSFIDENSKVLLEKYLKILKEFIASNDQVYMFHGISSGEERKVVDRLCHLMELGVRFCGTSGEQKIIAFKRDGKASDHVLAVMSRKRKNREDPDSCGDNKGIAELNKIWITQTLEKFSASDEEVYTFETKLSRREGDLVFTFCRERGLMYTLYWDGIKQRVSVYKTRKEVDNITMIENLPHVTCSAESDQIDKRKKSHKKEEPESAQHQNSVVFESKRVRITQILEIFLASEDEVYNFEDELSTNDRALVKQISHKMGLNCNFSGRGIRKKTSVYKTKKEVAPAKLLGGHPDVTFPEESPQNRKQTATRQHQNPIIDESTRIQISRTLENSSASKDEVYYFEANLSPEKFVSGNQLSQQMGFIVENSGSGIKQKGSVDKILKKSHTTPNLENLPCFKFFVESKHVLVNLFTRYPPDEDPWGAMNGACDDTTDRTEAKEDDIFSWPCMGTDEIAMRLEVLSNRVKISPDLKLINERRSKLPVASFKDIITSSVESHQVVIICGETGCGKTTQVFALSLLWSVPFTLQEEP